MLSAPNILKQPQCSSHNHSTKRYRQQLFSIHTTYILVFLALLILLLCYKPGEGQLRQEWRWGWDCCHGCLQRPQGCPGWRGWPGWPGWWGRRCRSLGSDSTLFQPGHPSVTGTAALESWSALFWWKFWFWVLGGLLCTSVPALQGLNLIVQLQHYVMNEFRTSIFSISHFQNWIIMNKT